MAGKTSPIIAALPETIKIGAYTVRIVKAQDHLVASEAWATWENQEFVIYVRHIYPNNELAVASLLHEITHACFTVYGMAREGINEEQVCILNDMIWVAVFKDNPWLLDWIKKGLK